MIAKHYKNKRGRKKKFSKQFREHLRIGLSAAVGFTIAFAWREPLLLFVNDFIFKYISSTLTYHASILSALIVTFLGVLLIWILSRYLR